MKLLWLFFIVSNLFYVFYFDENIFYLILFSVLFLPNFLNSNFYKKNVSLIQYVQYLRANLNYLLSFLEFSKDFNKKYFLILFSKLRTNFNYYSNVGFFSLFNFFMLNSVTSFKKETLNQTLHLINVFFLFFFKNVTNSFYISEKKQNVIAARKNLNKVGNNEGTKIFSTLQTNYNIRGGETIFFSEKKLNEVSSLLVNLKSNKK